MLEVPIFFLKLDGEPIEQLGVGRVFALQAEVLRGTDEAVSENALPHAVDENAGGEGMFRSGEPLG